MLPLLDTHRSKGTHGCLRFCKIDVGILQSQVRQLVVNMLYCDAPLFECLAKERVLVPVLLAMLIETDR